MKKLLGISAALAIGLFSSASRADEEIVLAPFQDFSQVEPNRGVIYPFIRDAGYGTVVIVIGDGFSDLDCILQDFDGITLAEDYTLVDVCVLEVKVYHSLPLTLTIRNAGDNLANFKLMIL